MATLKSTLFFAAAFGSFLFSDLHAQDQEPRDYLSIQPYGSYHNYFMEGEYNSRPCFGGGIKLGRTIIHLVHVELGLEYVQKRYTQTVTYTTAPSGLPKNFTYQCKVDYYNIPILFNISIIPHAGENQRMYFTSGFLLLNARNLYLYGDENSFPYPGKQSFSPKTGLALRNGLRYDRKLTRWMFLFAEAAFDCKLLREYNEYKAGPASPSSGPVRHDQNLSNEPYSFAFNLGLSFRLLSHPLDK